MSEDQKRIERLENQIMILRHNLVQALQLLAHRSDPDSFDRQTLDKCVRDLKQIIPYKPK